MFFNVLRATILFSHLLTTIYAEPICLGVGTFGTGGGTLEAGAKVFTMLIAAAATIPGSRSGRVDPDGSKYLLYLGEEQVEAMRPGSVIRMLKSSFRGNDYRVEIIFFNYTPGKYVSTDAKQFGADIKRIAGEWHGKLPPERFFQSAHTMIQYGTMKVAIGPENDLYVGGQVKAWGAHPQ